MFISVLTVFVTSCFHHTAMPVPTLTVEPSLSPVFAGEKVTLTCVIQPSSGWTYEWYKPWWFLTSETNTYTISRATVSDQGEYKCSGVRKTNRKSDNSNIVQFTVRGKVIILDFIKT